MKDREREIERNRGLGGADRVRVKRGIEVRVEERNEYRGLER